MNFLSVIPRDPGALFKLAPGSKATQVALWRHAPQAASICSFWPLFRGPSFVHGQRPQRDLEVNVTSPMCGDICGFWWTNSRDGCEVWEKDRIAVLPATLLANLLASTRIFNNRRTSSNESIPLNTWHKHLIVQQPCFTVILWYNYGHARVCHKHLRRLSQLSILSVDMRGSH